MAFDEVRLPIEVERGSRGGPAFATNVLELSNGHEQRNQEYDQPRGQWDIGYGIQSNDTLQAVVDFFYARRGRLRGFRFRDPLDFQIDTQTQFGTGDGSTVLFQLSITYGTFVRQIKKPVAGTVTVFVDDVPTAATLDTTTGEVTFAAAPADTAVLDWTGEYDVPVRFEDDDIERAAQQYDVGQIPRINLIELRT